MLAALHLHSTYSDGEYTLAELRDVFLRAGCRVIAVTDHAEAFSSEKLARYVAECADLSDEHITLVPSLEFACRDKMHILGYGVTRRYESDEPQDILRHIANEGGVAVIAHPRTDFFDWIRRFDELPQGIEVWNSKYDGRQAPRPETFRLVTELRSRKPDLHGFFGIDLHWRKQFRSLHVQLLNAANTLPNSTSHAARVALLDTLRGGHFVGLCRELRLPSHAGLPDALLRKFEVRHRNYQRFRKAMFTAKRMAESLGARAPAGLKAQLRRLF
jgi:predicted metal-dependent phosphoesterase TrpH